MYQRRDAFMLLGLLICITLLTEAIVEGNVVFNVQHKFGGLRRATLGDLKAHDMLRHGRSLASVDMPVGGDAKFTAAGLYYTQMAIGTPTKDFHLQIDTGSNLMWVNSAGCEECPKKSQLGFDHAFFDEKASSTSKPVTCDQQFCAIAHNGPYANCTPNAACEYVTTYADGSQIGGYFVKDSIRFDQLSADFKTKSLVANISFGCSSKKGKSAETSTDSVDGIIGFGQDNSSVISQLSMSTKISKVFSHCFDGKNGGGIFAIGDVSDPAVKNMSALVPNTPHYTITMMTINVGGKEFELNKGFFGIGAGIDTVIDSGATLAFFPEAIYKELIEKIMDAHDDVKTYTYEQQFTCFPYKGDVSKDFPLVTFNFEDSLTIKVYASEYLIQIKNGDWCLGWQMNNMKPNNEGDTILLGDLALANKLVTYNLEKQAIGVTEHDCTEGIKIKDVETGAGYELKGANISPPSSSASKQHGLNLVVTLSFIISAMLYHFTV
ncbi:hypothetical protein Leryth_018162 [Lithospermum erythrorhizon]|nr:hypothetical protein Leryth_018162 [Lithospermum erythrorhizon]